MLCLLYCFSTALAQPAQTWKTGQTALYAAGDDGDLQNGVDWPEPRFEDNGDGSITDHLTGLVWLKNANCAGYMNWNQALTYCNNLASGSCGLTDGSAVGDWRLPNRKELLSLIDYSRQQPALSQGHLFDNVQSSYYWSATTSANYTRYARIVSMGRGIVGSSSKSHSCYVWPVRAGQGGASDNLTILSPNSGEILVKGQDYTITWNSTNVTGNIQIDLYKGGTEPENMLIQLAAATANDGEYPFSPTDIFEDGSDYYIGISAENGTVWDFSNMAFTIETPNIGGLYREDFEDGKLDGIWWAEGTYEITDGTLHMYKGIDDGHNNSWVRLRVNNELVNHFEAKVKVSDSNDQLVGIVVQWFEPSEQGWHGLQAHLKLNTVIQQFQASLGSMDSEGGNTHIAQENIGVGNFNEWYSLSITLHDDYVTFGINGNYTDLFHGLYRNPVTVLQGDAYVHGHDAVTDPDYWVDNIVAHSAQLNNLSDSDGDGVPDDQDAFPYDPNEWEDTDGDSIGDNADTDDDNDGMPDDWESTYGLDPLVDDSGDDFDSDGFTNLEEFEGEGDPTDPHWVPRLLTTQWKQYKFEYDSNNDGVWEKYAAGCTTIAIGQLINYYLNYLGDNRADWLETLLQNVWVYPRFEITDPAQYWVIDFEHPGCITLANYPDIHDDGVFRVSTKSPCNVPENDPLISFLWNVALGLDAEFKEDEGTGVGSYGADLEPYDWVGESTVQKIKSLLFRRFRFNANLDEIVISRKLARLSDEREYIIENIDNRYPVLISMYRTDSKGDIKGHTAVIDQYRIEANNDFKVRINMGWGPGEFNESKASGKWYDGNGSIDAVPDQDMIYTEFYIYKNLRPNIEDSDSDGMLDTWEMSNFGDLTRDGTGDYDSDGLIDMEEYNNNTDPTLNDTDGDLIPDLIEVNTAGISPLIKDSTQDLDGDLFWNIDEYYAGTDLNDPDSKPERQYGTTIITHGYQLDWGD